LRCLPFRTCTGWIRKRFRPTAQARAFGFPIARAPLRLPIPLRTSLMKPRRRAKRSPCRTLGILRLRRKLGGHLSLGPKNILLKHPAPAGTKDEGSNCTRGAHPRCGERDQRRSGAAVGRHGSAGQARPIPLIFWLEEPRRWPLPLHLRNDNKVRASVSSHRQRLASFRSGVCNLHEALVIVRLHWLRFLRAGAVRRPAGAQGERAPRGPDSASMAGSWCRDLIVSLRPRGCGRWLGLPDAGSSPKRRST
jgi:hypothetical protein